MPLNSTMLGDPLHQGKQRPGPPARAPGAAQNRTRSSAHIPRGGDVIELNGPRIVAVRGLILVNDDVVTDGEVRRAACSCVTDRRDRQESARSIVDKHA